MRADEVDLAAAQPGEDLEGTHLVEQVVGELLAGIGDEPAAEPVQVAVADLGTDRDTVLDRSAQVRRMMAGSPAWKPQAMFAAVTTSSRASSSASLPAAVPLADVGRERYPRHPCSPLDVRHGHDRGLVPVRV